MTGHGIKLVWAGWGQPDVKEDSVIGFSERAYKRWNGQILPGTRMLLYETTTKRPGYSYIGTRCIVGEVEVIGTFKDGQKFAPPTDEHAHLLPVKVLRGRSEIEPIPIARVRAILGNAKFPHQGLSWLPLSKALYQLFLNEWA